MPDIFLILSKSAFAARRGVSVSAVCKWIERDHLTGTALTADGRINVEEAERQLNERLDHSRSIGKSSAAAARTLPTAAPLSGPVEAMAAIKLEQAQRALQRDREADLERRGLYVLADKIRREHLRELSQFITTVEQRLPELVMQLGGGKAEITLARHWWRSLRAAESRAASERAEALPEFVPASHPAI
jgi:hypothetical protein